MQTERKEAALVCERDRTVCCVCTCLCVACACDVCVCMRQLSEEGEQWNERCNERRERAMTERACVRVFRCVCAWLAVCEESVHRVDEDWILWWWWWWYFDRLLSILCLSSCYKLVPKMLTIMHCIPTLGWLCNAWLLESIIIQYKSFCSSHSICKLIRLDLYSKKYIDMGG